MCIIQGMALVGLVSLNHFIKASLALAVFSFIEVTRKRKVCK